MMKEMRYVNVVTSTVIYVMFYIWGMNFKVMYRKKQEKLIEHVFCPNHSGTHKDIYVQTIDHCNPNNQQRRGYFRIYYLDTMFPKGLNQKKLLRYI